MNPYPNNVPSGYLTYLWNMDHLQIIYDDVYTHTTGELPEGNANNDPGIFGDSLGLLSPSGAPAETASLRSSAQAVALDEKMAAQAPADWDPYEPLKIHVLIG